MSEDKKTVEVWKTIEGFEDYQVSNIGRVRSFWFGKVRILKPIKNKGYLQVALCKDGKKEQPKVHRLVANAFIPKIEGKEQVNHKNEIKTDNRATNLEWMTCKENINFGTRNQRSAEARSKAVLQFTKDLVFIREWPSTVEVQRQLGFSQGNISSCCRGERKSANGFIWRYAS